MPMVNDYVPRPMRANPAAVFTPADVSELLTRLNYGTVEN